MQYIIFDNLWISLEPLFKVLVTFFTSHTGIFFYCSGIFIWASIAALVLHRRITPVQNQIKKANEVLRKHAPEEFTANYYQLDDVCLNLPVLHNCWREFTEVLLFPGTDFENGDIIRNTRQPGSYLSQRTILWPRVAMRFYNSLPNMLTGLGILGTFIGLVAGISLAGPGLNSPDIQDAKDALQKLLSGASLAFLTSIFGLTTSIVFSWYEKKQVHKFDTLLNQFVEGLEERLEFISIEKIASLTYLESQKQTASLESFSNDLAVSLGDILENKISAPMNSTMLDIGKIMQEQKVILEGLRDDQKAANDENLEKLIEKFSESISGAAGREMTALADTITNLSERLESQISTMAESQVSIQKASQESVQKLQDSFHENTDRLQKEVSSAISTMVLGVRETVGEMTQMLKEVTKESAENMQKVSHQFSESITALKNTVSDMSKINEGTQEIMSDLDNLIAAVSQSHNELLKAAVPIQEAAVGMSSTSNSLKDTAELMNNTGVHLRTNVEIIEATQINLVQSWGDYQKRFETVDSSLVKIFEGLEQGLATYASSTKKYVEELDQHASKVVTHLAGASSELREAVEELGDVLDTMSTDAKANALSTKKSIEELDQYASKVVTHLAGVTS